ncbi:MAG: DUF1294 domain-containing protein [Clostridium sp.]|nr:DUF1294 domain-containing protein [Prevotella sp.]MCM1429039.1 DUF1294 domain-containing protein [Clostridium sp.]MCM1475430.1 DUF1294 domain-containing protein [Muribaculaceae bacterium]
MLYIFFALSLIAFILFFYDKHQAHYGMGRIPESVLFTSAALLGGFGALTAMILFRHKTQKRDFLIWIPILAVLDVAIIVLCQIFL